MERPIDADSLLTSYQVGELLQVNPSSINKWVKEGRIPAFRTPGGHHRIRAGELVKFLHGHKMPIPRPLRGAGRRRVLIVDDDPKQLKALERQLKPYGRYIDVHFEQHGIDALVQVGNFRPHVIVIDYVMPQLDGIEVIRRLKAMDDTKGIKVVLLSGRLTGKVEKQAIEAGAVRCLHKPLEVAALLEELEVREEAFGSF